MQVGIGISSSARITVGTSSDGITVPKLAVGSSVALLGDSMFARAANFTNSTAANTAENRQCSELMWCHFRKPRFIHRNWWDPTANSGNRIPTYGSTMASELYFSGLNFGYSGDTATGTLLRVQQVIDSNADACVYDAGTNVGTTDGDAQDTIDSIQAAVQALVAGGVRVILGTIRPRRVTQAGVAPDISPASMARILTINAAIRANWRAWGASALWDPWYDLIDPQYGVEDELYGNILPAYAIADGVHISPLGAWVASITLQAALDRVLGNGTWFDANAAANNIITNGILAGNTGTVGTGFVGNIAANWSILNVQGAGQPVTGTVTVANGVVTVNVESTGAGTANTFNTVRINPTPSPNSGFAANDWVVAMYEVEVTTANSIMAMCQVTVGNGSTISARGLGQTTSQFNLEPTPLSQYAASGWIVTEPLKIGAQVNLNPRLDVSVRTDQAGAFQFKVKRAMIRKISDPSVDYPWVE